MAPRTTLVAMTPPDSPDQKGAAMVRMPRMTFAHEAQTVRPAGRCDRVVMGRLAAFPFGSSGASLGARANVDGARPRGGLVADLCPRCLMAFRHHVVVRAR